MYKYLSKFFLFYHSVFVYIRRSRANLLGKNNFSSFLWLLMTWVSLYSPSCTWLIWDKFFWVKSSLSTLRNNKKKKMAYFLSVSSWVYVWASSLHVYFSKNQFKLTFFMWWQGYWLWSWMDLDLNFTYFTPYFWDLEKIAWSLWTSACSSIKCEKMQCRVAVKHFLWITGWRDLPWWPSTKAYPCSSSWETCNMMSAPQLRLSS